MENERKRFLTKEQVARHFQVSAKTIERWMVQGMPFMKINRRLVRFHLQDCDRWFEKAISTGSKNEVLK